MDREGVKYIAVNGARASGDAPIHTLKSSGCLSTPGKLQGLSSLRSGGLRSGARWAHAHSGEQGDCESPRDRGDVHAEYLRGPDRVVRSPLEASRVHRLERASAQPLRNGGRGNGAGVYGRGGSREGRYSGPASGPAMWIWRRSRSTCTPKGDPGRIFPASTSYRMREVLQPVARHPKNPTRANWSSRHFPARTRTPSTKASGPGRAMVSGRCRTRRSIRKNIGRSDQPIIRVNSQSAKGGVASARARL